MTKEATTLDPFSFCESLAATLPCRVITGELGPYLSRYTLREHADGSFDFLHFFHRGDADRELHNHPWAGSSLILAGGYVEERRMPDDSVAVATYAPGSINVLAPDTFHRVDLIDPRGCWTLFRVGVKQQSWGFWNRDTHVFTPWRDLLRARGRVFYDHREEKKPLEPGAGPVLMRGFLAELGVALHGCGACADCLDKTPPPTGWMPLTAMVMVVCPTCGNKRCPKASHHENDCTNSNAPGQTGNRYL
ncbi:MAG: hypothetical protein ACHREM_00395 [Polyangiales bacterium]